MVYHIMCRDRHVADVTSDENNIVTSIEKFVPDGMEQPFWGDFGDRNGAKMTARFYAFLKRRCYEDCRADLPQILAAAGLESNNPYEWVRVSHGVTYEDYFWIRFGDEDVRWDDVKVRN